MIDHINHIQGLFEAELPVDEYVIINSVWLTLMGLRGNGDLDLLLSSRLWRERYPEKKTELSFGIPGDYERRLRVHSLDSGPYGQLPGIADNDDAVYNHRIVLEGIPLIEPALYFRYKVARSRSMETEIAALPLWKRHRLLAGKSRKLFLKRGKDRRDFELIRQYFADGKHRAGPLSEITDTQWGLDAPGLAPFITCNNLEGNCQAQLSSPEK